MKTYSVKAGEIERRWFVVDAEGKVLGRVASEIARILRGKHKPTYTPHLDTGDFVVPIPAKKAGPFQAHVDKNIIFGIRPENIHDADFTPPNIDAEKVAVKVDVTELLGNEILLYLVSGRHTFVASVDPRSKLRVGQQSQVMFDMDNFHIFDAATEEAIR